MRKLKKIFHSTFMKVLSVLLIILFLFSLFFYWERYKKEINKIRGYYWVYRGDKAYDKKDLTSATTYYERGIKLHPWHFRAMYNLANIYVVYEDYYSALKNYERALKLRPDFDVARIDYAIILSQVYKIDEAILQYKQVLEYEPDRIIKIPFIYNNKKSYDYNRGVAYYNMGSAYRTKSLLAGLSQSASRQYLQKASKSYEEAVAILNNYNTHYNLALINQLLKNSATASYHYCKAMEISPMEYDAHFNYAVLLNDLKDYKGAKEEYEKAGLLLDSKGEYIKTRYIYEMLGEVNKKISFSNEKTIIDNTRYNEIYKNEIKKKEDKKDFEIYKNFSICANSEKIQKFVRRK